MYHTNKDITTRIVPSISSLYHNPQKPQSAVTTSSWYYSAANSTGICFNKRQNPQAALTTISRNQQAAIFTNTAETTSSCYHKRQKPQVAVTRSDRNHKQLLPQATETTSSCYHKRQKPQATVTTSDRNHKQLLPQAVSHAGSCYHQSTTSRNRKLCRGLHSGQQLCILRASRSILFKKINILNIFIFASLDLSVALHFKWSFWWTIFVLKSFKQWNKNL